MKRETKQEREAWSAHIEGREAVKEHKYKAVKAGKYPSQKHAEVAQKLWALAESGKIQDLREEVPFILVPGRNRVKGVTYVADFTFIENGFPVVADAKGMQTPVYKIKKRMMYLILGLTIEEM